jgi:hypothetical protein
MRIVLVGVLGTVLCLGQFAACTSTEGDDDDNDSGSGGAGGSAVPIQCNVTYCEDLIYYCTWMNENCSSNPDATVQGCVDQLVTNLSYCQLPDNYASCIADCLRDDPSQSCTQYNVCHDDHDCMWFGDCPT